MAIIDAKLEFDDGAVLSCSSAETNVSQNVIRLDALTTALMQDAWGTTVTPDIGEGNNGLQVNIQIASAFSASNSFTAKIYNHTTSTFSAGTLMSTIVFGSSGAALPTNVTTSRANFRLPAGTINKYLGIQYSCVTGANGTGKVDAWLGLDRQTPTT